jgi:hypothetical protein
LLAVVVLPITLAGFAYNSKTSILAASVATLAASLIVSFTFGGFFAATSVLPAALLVYMALLHREPAVTGAGAPGPTEWFPVGRIVVTTAALGAFIVSGCLVLATNQENGFAKLRTAVGESVTQALKAGMAGLPGGQSLSEAQLASLTDTMLNLMPGMSATLWMGAMLFCLWFAAHVALASGQLKRPWPDLGAITYPTGTPLFLAATLSAALFTDGVIRLVALAFAGALYAAYVLLGLAIIHTRTRGLSWRNPALTALYVTLAVFVTQVSLCLAVLGLIDSFKPLRGPPRGPPTVAPPVS